MDKNKDYGGLNKLGQEIPDPRPVSIPVGFDRPESLNDKIKRMTALAIASAQAAAMGGETFEESLDFDIPDDPVDRTTPYEILSDTEEAILNDVRLLQRIKGDRELRKKVSALLQPKPSGPEPEKGPGKPQEPPNAAPKAD